MRNLPPAALGGRASYLSGRFKPLYMMEGLDPSYDAVVFLGYHAAMQSPGVLSHTYNPRAIAERAPQRASSPARPGSTRSSPSTTASRSR